MRRLIYGLYKNGKLSVNKEKRDDDIIYNFRTKELGFNRYNVLRKNNREELKGKTADLLIKYLGSEVE